MITPPPDHAVHHTDQRRQAQAIAEAMLDPDIVRLREAQRIRREAQEHGTPAQRRIAALALAGGAIGALIAHVPEGNPAQAYVAAAVGCAGLGWFIQASRSRAQR